MVPWRFLVGTAACVLFPQAKGPLIAAWGLALLLEREKNVNIGEETSGQLEPVTLEWQDIQCAIVDKHGSQVQKSDLEIPTTFSGSLASQLQRLRHAACRRCVTYSTASLELRFLAAFSPSWGPPGVASPQC